MRIEPLDIPGAFHIIPAQYADKRGRFLEWYRSDNLGAANGHPMPVAQANISVSAQKVVRGIHFASTPPGQAKYVTCIRGTVVDFIVDIRVGSPTFGQHQMLRLDERERGAVYLAEGLGHALCALEDDATVVYMCSRTYDPIAEWEISPLDPVLDLKFPWPKGELLLSDKDANAPTLAEAASRGLLPDYRECAQWYDQLKSECG